MSCSLATCVAEGSVLREPSKSSLRLETTPVELSAPAGTLTHATAAAERDGIGLRRHRLHAYYLPTKSPLP